RAALASRRRSPKEACPSRLLEILRHLAVARQHHRRVKVAELRIANHREYNDAGRGMASREELSAWFNALPCDGLGKEHFDALVVILSQHPNPASSKGILDR
ncbi:hypothetical protein, partial [Tardiphaga sp.]|uniref:hypothetical protein n=1 Tax=Tardiphaga sp. TaxID=1926292 RepID=UPI002608B56D